MQRVYSTLVFIVAMVCAAGGFLSAQEAAAKPAGEADEIRIVTLGDSITKGVRSGVTNQQTFAALLEASLREQGVAAEVINVGIGGERTDQAMARLQRDVIAQRPAIVTIMYGVNDSYVDQGKQASRISAEEYRQNLEHLVERLRAAGIQPILMTPPRWGDAAGANGVGEHPNVRLEQYVEQCRDAARKTKTPLIDHFRRWSAAAEQGSDTGAWTTDQCHPNPEGHRILADAITPVILRESAKDSQFSGD